ncbi:vesicular-fusion protein SEC17 [Thelephora terrestris]|uniref:Vesicular-fusion protein SEC17 n=1 Tax=Thelephora terrestris TaxID=56493 RepID=A0A9P6HHB1_9AGAM|nr:vesicular-fusion protein SEC17 [Thelephora terrestris]
MAPQKSHAQTLLEKADKKAASSGGWFSSSNSKWEEAGDLYQQAANAFKIDKLFKEAGDAHAREAECRENCKEINDAANAWWNAAKAYKRGYPDLAIAALSQTVTFLTQSGRFRQAADREKEIAQIHIQEKQDLRKGCESYERAGEWYSQEDATATANACFKDAADLHAELEDYPAAIARYNQVAAGSLGSNLTKYSVKDYWLRAGLCSLAMGDTVGCRRNITTYSSQDTTFPSTRECKFLGFLMDALESNDQEGFTTAVVEYDQVMKLDNWKTAILLKIKRSIAEEPQML